MTLDVSGLVKRHGAAPAVLAGVCLRIEAGVVLGLAGPSGAGKSTLARCIAGIERADAGSVAVDGRVLPPLRTRAQRRLVQYVWQEPQAALSPYLTALQAVAEPLQGFSLAPRAQHADIAAQALARLSIAPDAMRRRPHALSGGQCQRVVLARALVAQPQVLLLDEPFSALDTVTTAALLRELAALLAGHPIAVLLVSHDRAVLRRMATRCVLLADGCLSSVRP